MLSDDEFSFMKTCDGFRKKKNSFDNLIEHWKKALILPKGDFNLFLV